MKKYKYAQTHINKFVGTKTIPHRQMIDEYSQKGYKYIGFIPININEYGKIKDIDLIFEKDE